MLISRCKAVLKLFFCLVVSVFALIGFRVLCVSKLSNYVGERVFYLYTPSSQATIKSKLSLTDCFFVQGESVQFSLNGESGKKRAEEIMQDLQAELVFTETAGGTQSFYAYSKKLGKSVVINGKKINLHIAVAEDSAVVGTPIIFGGF